VLTHGDLNLSDTSPMSLCNQVPHTHTHRQSESEREREREFVPVCVQLKWTPHLRVELQCFNVLSISVCTSQIRKTQIKPR